MFTCYVWLLSDAAVQELCGRQAQVLRGDGPEDAWLVGLERRRKLRPQEGACNPRAIVPGSILGISWVLAHDLPTIKNKACLGGWNLED